MNTKKIKFAGPSKKMMDALKNEGLNISWPKTVKDENDLAIEGTYYTGINDYEKGVTIDLRDKVALATKSGVDKAISYELDEAYEAYNINEEMSLNLEANGAPDAADLLADLQEAEKCLKRFSEVADAVACGRPVPAKEDNEEITINGKDAKRVADLLETIADFNWTNTPTNNDKAFARMMCDELRNKIKEG